MVEKPSSFATSRRGLVLAENMSLAAAAHSKNALLAILHQLALRSVAFDANQAGDADSSGESTKDLTDILETGIEVMEQLERRLASSSTEAESDFPLGEENTWIGMKVTIGTGTTPRLADICFAATLELSRALRQLLQAKDSVQRLV